MHRFAFFAVLVIGLTASTGRAQTGESRELLGDRDSQVAAVKAIVDRFLTMDAAGNLLGPEQWNDITDLATSHRPFYAPLKITVVKDFAIQNPVLHGDRAVIEVDYSVWGFILSSPDSPFHFLRLEALAPREPVKRRERFVLVFSDKYMAVQQGAGQTELKGPLKWRIGMDSAHPHITVETAIRYLSEKRDSASDPATRAKADETLARMNEIKNGTLPLAQQGASGVVRDFIQLESQAGPDQWGPLARFFLETPKPDWNKVNIVDIVDAGADSAFSIEKNKAEVEILTNSLGQLDSSLRLSDYPSFRIPLVTPSASACYGDDRFGFTLALSSKHRKTAPGGSMAEHEAPLAWRIEVTSFEPLITLDTAIRYVKQARDMTTNEDVKRNAARTLNILQYYKLGKPLPENLSSPEPGGCG